MVMVSKEELLKDRQRTEKFLRDHGEKALGKKMTFEEFLEWMKRYDYLVLILKDGHCSFRRYNSKRIISEKERLNRERFTQRMQLKAEMVK